MARDMPPLGAHGLPKDANILQKAMLSSRIHPDHDPSYGEHTPEDLVWDNRRVDTTFWVLSAIVFLVVAYWFINRFTDGIWPTERRLARDTRERAAEYRRRKKDEDAERETLLSPQL